MDMNNSIEEQKIEFAKQLALDFECSYDEMLSIVKSIHAENKLESAIKQYNLDKEGFYIWMSCRYV